MKLFVCGMFAIIVCILAACAAPGPAPVPANASATPAAGNAAANVTPAATGGPTRLQTLRIELPVDASLSDLSRLMAADTLRAQGYTVEAVDLNDNALSVQALEQGDLDLAYISNGVAWTAIARGAKIRTILDDVNDTRVLVVAPGITTCQDLQGKKVAVAGTNSTQALLVKKYISTTCPEVKIELVVMASNSSRLIALAAGQVDAATVNLTEELGYEYSNKTKLNRLSGYSDLSKNLRGASQVIRLELIEKYPETAKDIVRALLQARRDLQDPQVLKEKAIQYLKMEPADAEILGKSFLEQKIWDLNGGYTPQILQRNLDFFVETGGVPEGLKVEQLADLTILNAVLDEIGRK